MDSGGAHAALGGAHRLIVERGRIEPVQAITRADMRAEGLRPLLGGLVWRAPAHGIGLSPAASMRGAGIWIIPRRAVAGRTTLPPSCWMSAARERAEPRGMDHFGRNRQFSPALPIKWREFRFIGPPPPVYPESEAFVRRPLASLEKT
jgi:hypothetical protein